MKTTRTDVLRALYPHGIPAEAYENLEMELDVAARLMAAGVAVEVQAEDPKEPRRQGRGGRRAPYTKGKAGDVVHFARFSQLRAKGYSVCAAQRALRIGVGRANRLEKMRLRREGKASKPKEKPSGLSPAKAEQAAKLQAYLSAGTRTFADIQQELGIHWTGVYPLLARVPGLEKVRSGPAGKGGKMLYSAPPVAHRNGVNGAHA